MQTVYYFTKRTEQASALFYDRFHSYSEFTIIFAKQEQQLWIPFRCYIGFENSKQTHLTAYQLCALGFVYVFDLLAYIFPLNETMSDLFSLLTFYMKVRLWIYFSYLICFMHLVVHSHICNKKSPCYYILYLSLLPDNLHCA